jgi:hypothetical protein
MEKPFIAFSHRTRNSRLSSLLELINLRSQMIEATTLSSHTAIEIIQISKYDFRKSNTLLNNEVSKSKHFLRNALGIPVNNE